MKKTKEEKLYSAIKALWPDANVSVTYHSVGYWRVIVDGRSQRGKFVLCVQCSDPINMMHLLVDNCPAEFLNA